MKVLYYVMVAAAAAALACAVVGCQRKAEEPATAETVAETAPTAEEPETPLTISEEAQKELAPGTRVAVMELNEGVVEIELFDKETPKTAENFIALCNDKFYDGVPFHRVEKDFVVQAGDHTGTGMGGPGFYIPQEFNRRPHLEGALSMLRRASHVDTAGSQFFVCFRMEPHNQKLLDGQYTVFGRVARGFETVRKIGEVRVDSKKKPVETIRITQMTLVTR